MFVDDIATDNMLFLWNNYNYYVNKPFYKRFNEQKMSAKKLIAANWKMNGLRGQGRELASGILDNCRKAECDIALFPPFTLLLEIADILQSSNVALGGQDCHIEEKGAYTGDISASMLKDCGCSYVILGHSERRKYHNETNSLVNLKAQAAHKEQLTTIICVGESLEIREQGKMYEIVGKQLGESIPSGASSENTIIAYEPVWAIGTGKTANIQQIEEMHQFIKDKSNVDLKILYGGSAKPDNAKEILSIDGVGGLLVGGASLDVSSFSKIIEATS